MQRLSKVFFALSILCWAILFAHIIYVFVIVEGLTRFPRVNPWVTGICIGGGLLFGVLYDNFKPHEHY